MSDPEDDEDDDLEIEPDDPDAWRDYAEDHETLTEDTLDAEGVPLV